MIRTKSILVTRPAEDSASFCQTLEAEGFKVLAEPMLEIVPLDFPVPDLSVYRGLIFTSTNGVRAFSARVTDRNITAFCVGDRTADTAEGKGFTDVVNAGGAVKYLAAVLLSAGPGDGKPFLYVRGADISGVELAASGMPIAEIIVYKARLVQHLSAACVNALKNEEIVAAPFFSKRTAENFVRLVEQEKLLGKLSGIKFLSISEAVLKSVQTYGWKDTYIAPTPDGPGMLHLVQAHGR